MAKRFFNTSRIEEEWYLQLSCKHRELLRYCESKCDGAGIFSFSESIASIYIGEKVTIADLVKLPVSKLPNGKYFVVGFCLFQNGKLSETSPPHKTILKSIEENGVTESVLFSRASDRLPSSLQEREEEIAKDKEQEIQGSEEKKLALLILPFTSDLFSEKWGEWKEYLRTEKKDKIKTSKAEQRQLNELLKLSKNNEATAIKILDQSMNRRWKGLFELKEEQTHSSTQQKLSGDYGTLD